MKKSCVACNFNEYLREIEKQSVVIYDFIRFYKMLKISSTVAAEASRQRWRLSWTTAN